LALAEQVNRLEGGLEAGKDVLVRVAEKSVCQLAHVGVEAVSKLDLGIDQRNLSEEVKADVRGSTVGTEESDREHAVVAAAGVARQFPKKILAIEAWLGRRRRTARSNLNHAAGRASQPLEHIFEN
jgi:hypothetical protein